MKILTNVCSEFRNFAQWPMQPVLRRTRLLYKTHPQDRHGLIWRSFLVKCTCLQEEVRYVHSVYSAAPFFLLKMHVVKNCSLFRRHINHIPSPTALRGIVHFGLYLFAWLQPCAKSALIRRLDCNFLRSIPGWIIILWFCILHV